MASEKGCVLEKNMVVLEQNCRGKGIYRLKKK